MFSKKSIIVTAFFLACAFASGTTGSSIARIMSKMRICPRRCMSSPGPSVGASDQTASIPTEEEQHSETDGNLKPDTIRRKLAKLKRAFFVNPIPLIVAAFNLVLSYFEPYNTSVWFGGYFDLCRDNTGEYTHPIAVWATFASLGINLFELAIEYLNGDPIEWKLDLPKAIAPALFIGVVETDPSAMTHMVCAAAYMAVTLRYNIALRDERLISSQVLQANEIMFGATCFFMFVDSTKNGWIFGGSEWALLLSNQYALYSSNKERIQLLYSNGSEDSSLSAPLLAGA